MPIAPEVGEDADPEEKPQAGGPREGPLLAVVALATILVPLNSTMIVVALPDVAATFGVGFGETTWLVVGYLICMAAVQPIGGALGDAYGHRPVILGALLGFLATSVAAPSAPALPALVGLRLGQALSGALAIPNATALIRIWVPGRRRGTAYGLVDGAIGMVAALGPPLGGLLVALGGWQAVFVVNVPLATAALALGWAFLPREPRRTSPGRFDVPGAALLAGWLGGLALSTSLLGRSQGFITLLVATVVTVGLFAAFVGWERKVARPVVRLELFRERVFAAAAGAVALRNLAMYTTFLALPQFLVLVQHRSSEEVGAVLAALSVPMVVLGPAAGRLADLLGRRPVAAAGAAITAASLAPLLWLGPGWSPWLLAGPLMIAGCGLALQGPAVRAAAPPA